MLASSRKLASIGAQFAICPDNTIHQAFELVTADSPIPWLHIADAVAQEATKRKFKVLGITGTKYPMTGPGYPDTMRNIPESTVEFRTSPIGNASIRSYLENSSMECSPRSPKPALTPQSRK